MTGGDLASGLSQSHPCPAPVLVNENHPSGFKGSADGCDGAGAWHALTLLEINQGRAGDACPVCYVGLFQVEKGTRGPALIWGHSKSDLMSDLLSDMMSDTNPIPECLTMALSNPDSGHAPGLPARLASWREAYERSDAEIIEIEGLVQALDIIAHEHPHLSGRDHGTAALLCVLRAVGQRLEVLTELRSAEYKAGFEIGRPEDRGASG